jgi:hypothetical protein
MISLPRKLFGSRCAPWGALLLAVVAAAALRYAAMDRLAPREFSYFIESCFRFRYAEMRMLGEEPPALDRAGQWPEGFSVDRMILSTPDRLAAAFYRLRGGDTFFASRDLVNLLSAGSVVVFTALALALFRRPGPAAAAVAVYGVTFGAFSRSWGNFLREDFAMPGLLAATAAAVYLLTAERVRRPWLFSLAAAAATFWAGSCWHMSQFYLAVLALFVVAYGVAGRASRAAWAGGGLWVGLAAAAMLNQPLWVKGALWNVSAALTRGGGGRGPGRALAGFRPLRRLRPRLRARRGETRPSGPLPGPGGALAGGAPLLGRALQIAGGDAIPRRVRPARSRLSPRLRLGGESVAAAPRRR